MVFDIIPFLVIIISLIIIIFIIGKKFPELKILDVSTIVEVKESVVKKKILEMKWKRAITEWRGALKKIAKPILDAFFHFFRGLYRKVVQLEKKYSQESLEKKESSIDSEVRIEKYLLEANGHKNQGRFLEAEEAYIKALEIEDKNILAYQGLGELYLENKDYAKARETFSFLTKLLSVHRADDDNHFLHTLSQGYAQLGEIERHLNNMESSIKYFKKALQLEPNNPRYLDLLLHLSIIVKDKKLAQRTLRQLKKTNPDNNKIEEFEQKISEI